MNPLFENAIDSLVIGIGFYIDKTINNPHKHSILTIFHSIELLLKERLYRENHILIYKNIDKPISDESFTVGVRDVFTRLRNIGVRFEQDEQKIIVDLQKRRNRIEHHYYVEDDNDFFIIGKSLRFIYYFLKTHLNEEIEEYLDHDTYSRVREIILKYEERLEEAKAEVEKLTTPITKDDLCAMQDAAICPECGNETVVIGTKKGNYCYFCRMPQDLSQCDRCGRYFPPCEINEFENCDDCFTERLDRL